MRAWLPLLFTAVVSAGCAPDCAPPRGESRPNVILVTIDTLRADHLGAYGSRSVRTPHLDRLAREGVLFEHAYSQSHITVPSHISILSALPVVEHGVAANDQPVARAVVTLPALLRQAGYHTAAFVSAVHLGPRRAAGQLVASALETFEFPERASKPRRAEETNARLFRWLRGRCGGPFFAWVHYWDPHMPYLPPAPYDVEYYRDDPRAERFTSLVGVRHPWYHLDLDGFRRHLAREAKGVRALKHEFDLRTQQVRRLVLYPVGAHAYDPDGSRRLHARLHELGDVIRPHVPFRPGLADWLTGVRDVRFPLAQYAGEVSYTDAQVGALRAEIERLGIRERTVLLVTADHGEVLGEHGIWFEHLGLHDPSVRVPLIVWAPGRLPSARRGDAATGLDVAPTLLALAGVPVAAGMRGRDLFGAAAPPPSVVSEGLRGAQVSIRDERWKLIRTLADLTYAPDFERRAGTVELYDLRADPGELHDVVATEAGARVRLGAALDAWLAAHPATPAGAPDVTDKLEELRALGYVE
jgi:arylsulfatase A-like enzyme